MAGGFGLGWVDEVEATLAAGVGGLDPDVVLATEAPALWCALDRVERLATSAKVLLARRVADSWEWKKAGYKSAAEYLAAKAGTTTGRARSELETSKRLSGQPNLDEACRKGEVSATQAEAISAAAAADPAAESRLVAKAKQSTVADLREECARTRAAADPDPEATHRRIHRDRHLRRFSRADGTWCLSAQGTADDAARFNAALDPIIDEIFGAARVEGRREPHDAYAFDALIALADRARGAAPTADDGDPGDPGGSGDSGDSGDDDRPRARRSPAPTHLALLRLDVEALRRGAVDGDERCEITGIGPIPVRVARELLGDAIVKLVLTRGVDVAHVTHLGRGPTAAQRIALLWTSPGCSNLHCHRTLVQIDHRHPWTRTHHTRLDELDPLCHHDHQLKTHHGWALTTGTGKRPLVAPDDPRHPNHATPPSSTGPDPPHTLFQEAG